jgi:hypothetical protein
MQVICFQYFTRPSSPSNPVTQTKQGFYGIAPEKMRAIDAPLTLYFAIFTRKILCFNILRAIIPASPR